MLALVVPACTSSAPAGVPKHATVTVQPANSLADQAVHINVAGLSAGELATVQVTSTDSSGVPWVAAARYRADASGRINLDRAAPVSGSYRGVSGMGLIWSMHQVSPGSAAAAREEGYFWSLAAPFRCTVTVNSAGTTVARTSFQRRFSAGQLITQQETLQANGFVGEFVQPGDTSVRRPAVLVLGGSEGGLPGILLPDLLASHGYAVLGVAYFGLPGLPSTLADIPLEYFAKALRWLAAQPGVNPAKIAVLGVSRGSEAAQLLGVHYPDLVHAVIASVPSDAAICSYPGCRGAAWTLDGRPVPFTKQFGSPSPTDDPAAVIPDQQINGPVFLDCGEADQTWPSCPYARAILSRLDKYHDRWPHVLYAYPGAGHLVGSFVPYEPWAPDMINEMVPGAPAIQEADAMLWPHLLSFLAAFAASSR